MKVLVKRVSEATSSRTGKQYQMCVGETEDECVTRFFANGGEYKPGDMVELYLEFVYGDFARVGHKRID